MFFDTMTEEEILVMFFDTMTKEEILEGIYKHVYNKSPDYIRDYLNKKKKFVFETKVVGVTFAKDAQKILSFLSKVRDRDDYIIELKREPENTYDSNAIGVWVKKLSKGNTVRIGYINRHLAKILAKLLDMGIGVRVTRYSLVGGGDLNYGIDINYVLRVD